MEPEEYPLDEASRQKLRRFLLPKTTYGKWTLADQLVTKTVNDLIDDCKTIEEFIAKLDRASEESKSKKDLNRVVQLAVKEKVQEYLDQLKRDR